MLSGGFDPDRLAPPGRTSPVVSRIVGHDLQSQQDSSSPRPDDESLSRMFRELVTRFDELSSENSDLREANDSLKAEIEGARERLAGLERSIAAQSAASHSVLTNAARVLERAERVIEFRQGGIRAETESRFEAAKQRVTELQTAAAFVIDEARELSWQRALEVDLETLSLLRESRELIQAGIEKLHSLAHTRGDSPSEPAIDG